MTEWPFMRPWSNRLSPSPRWHPHLYLKISCAVMEGQQGKLTSFSSQAGITTTLNSRCSVLAAANSVFGRWDDTKGEDNIDFMPTILSRFDMIFIIKDQHDQQRDMVRKLPLKIESSRNMNIACWVFFNTCLSVDPGSSRDECSPERSDTDGGGWGRDSISKLQEIHRLRQSVSQSESVMRHKRYVFLLLRLKSLIKIQSESLLTVNVALGSLLRLRRSWRTDTWWWGAEQESMNERQTKDPPSPSLSGISVFCLYQLHINDERASLTTQFNTWMLHVIIHVSAFTGSWRLLCVLQSLLPRWSCRLWLERKRWTRPSDSSRSPH